MITVAFDGEIDEKELSKQLAAKLPAIAVPRKFLVFDELPKMGSGKIDFRSTTEMVKAAIRREVAASHARRDKKMANGNNKHA